jgi:hypothetical protein
MFLSLPFVAGMVLMKEYAGLWTALNATVKADHQEIRMTLNYKIEIPVTGNQFPAGCTIKPGRV